MGWVVNATPRPLYPRERDWVPIVQDAEWTPGPVWAVEENLAPTGFRSPDSSTRGESLYRLIIRAYKGKFVNNITAVSVQLCLNIK